MGELRLPKAWLREQAHQDRTRFFRLSQLRRLRGREQVAAVCYRIRKRQIEFLLVQTRRGRWTFPKGSAEPGLTTAQAAALEAFEEAGVHGRMEEASFARYIRPNRERNGAVLVVTAHLCEVSRLDPPPEAGRKPTWFAMEKAKRRLRADRGAEYGKELARVIERAAQCLSGRIVAEFRKPAEGLQFGSARQ